MEEVKKEREFVDGLYAKKPTVEFIKCKISIKRKDLGNWLRGKEDDWININVKEASSMDDKGNPKWYCEIDTWKPNANYNPSVTPTPVTVARDDFEDKDIPF